MSRTSVAEMAVNTWVTFMRATTRTTFEGGRVGDRTSARQIARAIGVWACDSMISTTNFGHTREGHRLDTHHCPDKGVSVVVRDDTSAAALAAYSADHALNSLSLLHRGVHVWDMLGGRADAPSECVLEPGAMRYDLAVKLKQLQNEGHDINALDQSALDEVQRAHVTVAGALASFTKCGGVGLTFAMQKLRGPKRTRLSLASLFAGNPGRIDDDYTPWDPMKTDMAVTLSTDTTLSDLMPVFYALQDDRGEIGDDYHPFDFQKEVNMKHFRSYMTKYLTIVTADSHGKVDVSKLDTLENPAYLPLALALETEQGRELAAAYQKADQELEVDKIIAWQAYIDAVEIGMPDAVCEAKHSDFLSLHKQQVKNDSVLAKAMNAFLVERHPELVKEHSIDPRRFTESKRNSWQIIAERAVRPLDYTLVPTDATTLFGEPCLTVADDGLNAELHLTNQDGVTVSLELNQHQIRLMLAPFVYASDTGDVTEVTQPTSAAGKLARDHLVNCMVKRLQQQYPAARFDLHERLSADVSESYTGQLAPA